jgi:nucleoside-diphosphate-sugar epimerase
VAALRRAPGFELAELNLLDEPALGDAVEGLDAICHLAGRPGVRRGRPEVYEAGNVGTTAAVLRAAHRSGVGRVLLASSSSIYGGVDGRVAEDAAARPLSEYGRSKLRAERLARREAAARGIELIVLRYFTVYGPRQRPDMAFARFIRAAVEGEPLPLLGDGSQVRHFTYVGDAADATALAIEAAASLSAAFALIGEALGRAPELEQRGADPRDPTVTAADLTRIALDLGWEPRTGLREGLELQAAATAAEGSPGRLL